MNFELIDQSIQYTFLNDRYGEVGAKARTFKNVKQGVSAAGLAEVGGVLADLQGDDLGSATLIQKQAVPLN
ncbi:DUF1659 domain-containing protein [Lactobacillus xylocopicola]|uniref:DUF1659 domain-containing protein n=1 Tax=Lactobacillus xylocopicola TaxID=2976676 RepID=A0ABN6SNC8_9LACO|nr:DUF1659 domain-containing protein [Lactobacillus xylocopicola]BDR61104.1 hypothetical protein KIM322_13650 [Lactobacillus xylocopicola]